MSKTSLSFAAAARKIQARQKALDGAQISGLRVIGEQIMTDAKASRPGAGVPKDTGVLAGTGTVSNLRRDAVILSFGGAAAPYALVQHEKLNFRHKLGEARYLVRAVERWQKAGFSVRTALVAMLKAAGF